MVLNRIHHIAIICSDYARSKKFYTEILGLPVVGETFRENRRSWKLDLEREKTASLRLPIHSLQP